MKFCVRIDSWELLADALVLWFYCRGFCHRDVTAECVFSTGCCIFYIIAYETCCTALLHRDSDCYNVKDGVSYPE